MEAGLLVLCAADRIDRAMMIERYSDACASIYDR